MPTLNKLSQKTIYHMAFGKMFFFFYGIQRVVPIAQDSAILPARIANHSTRGLIHNHVRSVTKFLALLAQENFDKSTRQIIP